MSRNFAKFVPDIVAMATDLSSLFPDIYLKCDALFIHKNQEIEIGKICFIYAGKNTIHCYFNGIKIVLIIGHLSSLIHKDVTETRTECEIHMLIECATLMR